MIEKLALLFIILSGCTHTRVQSNIKYPDNTRLNSDSLYTIYKIDSVNNYYLIYAKRKTTLYKIVSKKETISDCKHVQLGKQYELSLSSIWSKPIMINGVNVAPSGTPHVTCLSFDDSTKICLERDSINDLHYTENIKGLCFIQK